MTTLLLIGITIAVSIAAFNRRTLLERLLLWPPAIAQQHQYDRLLTHGFVHADPPHLIFNMFTLYFFGRAVEGFYQAELGPAGFALFYGSAIVAAIVPSYLQHRKDSRYRSLGASGGVSAVLFAFILFRPWATIYVFVLPVPAILYALAFFGWTWYQNQQQRDRINHSAHLWGAFYGVALTLLIEPRAFAFFIAQLSQPHFGR
jgi:membrane associated rhomboid family serine protease